MKINCIIIEDEPLALQKTAGFVKDVEYLNLLQAFDNAVDAIGYLKNNAVDLIFLDIRMKRLTGLQFLESLHTIPKVIITSAYDEYALKGYEFDVSDYLLKPFSFERFLKATDKVYDELQKIEADKRQFCFVKTENRLERIEYEDILFVQGMKDYLQIHTKDKRIMTLLTFKKMSEILPQSDFIRVHHSYIVAISKIESIEKHRIKINNELIPISDSYKGTFYRELEKRNIII